MPLPMTAMPGAPTRARLLDAVRARPGATASELARAVGVDPSTATYHLRRLESRGAVQCEKHRGRLHFFVSGQASARERALAISARLENAGCVLSRLGAAPQPLGAVADGLGMSPAGVYWHLRRLAELGLVVAEGPPRSQRYRLAPLLAGAPPFMPLPADPAAT